jgi:hypothetical protein
MNFRLHFGSCVVYVHFSLFPWSQPWGDNKYPDKKIKPWEDNEISESDCKLNGK